MKVNMRNVYILFAVILLTVLVAYFLFYKNKSEMFNTINGANNEIRMNQEILNYFLRRPTLPVNQAQANIQDQIHSQNQAN